MQHQENGRDAQRRAGRISSAPQTENPGLDLGHADLSGLASTGGHLLTQLERFVEMPTPLDWPNVAFAALYVEQEMAKLTEDPDILLYHGPTERASPFRELLHLLCDARPDPAGWGQQAGGIWRSGPHNAENARRIAEKLRPIVKRLEAITPAKNQFIPTPLQRRVLSLLHGKAKKLDQLADTLRICRTTLSGRVLKELKQAGLIKHETRLGGYFRPDAPPPGLQG